MTLNCLFIHIEHSCTLTSFALPPTCKPGRKEDINQIVWNQLVLDRFSIDITCHKKLLLLFIASAGLDLSCCRRQILPALFSSPASMSLSLWYISGPICQKNSFDCDLTSTWAIFTFNFFSLSLLFCTFWAIPSYLWLWQLWQWWLSKTKQYSPVKRRCSPLPNSMAMMAIVVITEKATFKSIGAMNGNDGNIAG